MVIGLICAAGGGKFWAGAMTDYSINNKNVTIMKKRRIYSEQGSSIKDMSKDRIHLNMSWNEYNKLIDFIDFARWELPTNSRLQKKARNLSISFRKAEEQTPIWLDEQGRAK